MTQLGQVNEILGLIYRAMDIADNLGDIPSEEADDAADYLYEKLGDAAHYATRVVILLKRLQTK